MAEDWSELRIPCPWLELESFAELVPRYNIAPTDMVWTITDRSEPLQRRWGLVPHWAKDTKGRPLINARVETIDKKPAFRSSFAKKRCLVPISGFYEWQTEDGKKQPYLFQGQDRLLFLAGIRTGWKSPDGEVIRSFSVITGPARGEIAQFHNRMPKILPPSVFGAWLSEEATVGELHEILQDTAITDLQATKVSTRVNSVKNDDPQCAEPLLG